MSTPIPEYLHPLIAVSAPLIAVAVLGGLWLALGRAAMNASARVRTWAAIGIPFALWFAVAWLLGRSGALESQPDVLLAPIVPAIALPAVIGAVLLLRSPSVRALLNATPASWLIGVQVYRALGFVFLALLAKGLQPADFALPAGTGDVIVGLTALPVAFWVVSGSGLSRIAAYAWNIFGIADLAVAITTGFLTSPGQLQQLAFDHPNTLITAYPLVMIPAFAVPLAMVLHVLSLWQLNGQSQTAAGDTRRNQRKLFGHWPASRGMSA